MRLSKSLFVRKCHAASAALALLAIASSASATTIASWTFETSPPALSNSSNFGPLAADSGSGTASAHHASSATDWTSTSGNGSPHSWSSNNWAKTEPFNDYYQFQVSTTGLQNIEIDWDQTGSSTSPGQFALQWSTDGTSFSTFLSYSVLIADGSISKPFWNTTTEFSQYHFSEDLSSVTNLNNQSAIFLRLTAESSASNANGTDRLDNVVIQSTPEPSTATLLCIGAVGILGSIWRARKRVALVCDDKGQLILPPNRTTVFGNRSCFRRFLSIRGAAAESRNHLLILIGGHHHA